MKRILIISVHPVLEYDERHLFTELGYQCFSLGFYSDFDHKSSDSLRTAFSDNAFLSEARNLFINSGCQITPDDPATYLLSQAFVDFFDIIVVHHNYHFIVRNWISIRHTKVVWRTIGQELSVPERSLMPYREHGLFVVRWSPAEREIDGYIGEDAIIRASKRRSEFLNWRPFDERIVTFNNNFSAREKALSKDFYMECIEGLPAMVYGLGNDDLSNWGGILSAAEQIDILSKASAAFITGTYPAPYTLGFIEAWMAGTPVVHVGIEILRKSFSILTFEIPQLIENGVNGFIANNVTEARSALINLQADKEMAYSISRQGIASAERYFGWERGLHEWAAFFENTLNK